jgi:hypothetical protein
VRPFLNAGFAAGTPGKLAAYLRSADEMLHSFTLEGSTDWGDQTAFNLYCHTHPDAWKLVDEGWNYCLFNRDQSDFTVHAGRVRSATGLPVYVVHGTAHSFRQLELACN